jgi:hypothetical protein
MCKCTLFKFQDMFITSVNNISNIFDSGVISCYTVNVFFLNKTKCLIVIYRESALWHAIYKQGAWTNYNSRVFKMYIYLLCQLIRNIFSNKEGQVIRIRKLKNRQHNGQKKKDKQRSTKHTYKAKDE